VVQNGFETNADLNRIRRKLEAALNAEPGGCAGSLDRRYGFDERDEE
jgi:hypothetical protein